MLAEGLTLPCPAVAVLLMAGAAVASGKMSFWLIVCIAASAYTVGSYAPYLLGKHCMRVSPDSWAGKVINRSSIHLDKLRILFSRYGEQSVALARPFWIGNYVSYFAGLSSMPSYRFLILTFGGIMAWSVAVVSLGQAFSANLAQAALLVKQYSLLAFCVIATIILVLAFVSNILRCARQSRAFL